MPRTPELPAEADEMQCKLQPAKCKVQIGFHARVLPQFAFRNLHFAVCIAFTRCSIVATILVLALLSGGCIMGKQHPAATQPATAIDPKAAQPEYWIKQPGIAHLAGRDFDRLWNACRDAAIADGFTIDRTDYREGLLTTLPLVSKQVYEFWRNDVVDSRDLAQSTFGTIRRTARFTIKRLGDGSFEATPKVLVERYSTIERRITSVAQYHEIFSLRVVDVTAEIEQSGMSFPAEYWYAIGRDHALEKQLAQSARARIKSG